jgi:hypothetical protein
MAGVSKPTKTKVSTYRKKKPKRSKGVKKVRTITVVRGA